MDAMEEKLNPRELELVQLIADGRSLREAAECMGLQYQTVAGYISNARQKLDTPTNANLVATAVRRGLID